MSSADPVPSARPHLGRVTSFDPRRGLGLVTEADGDQFEFHATAIADGSRVIAAGTAVCFSVVAGRGGRYEARALTALASPPAA
ncbi:MAG TPA: cold shock domain-containing protein [Acidimicrobiales bacterium]|nr:cold shock domain-containing protein [Acidimicrobiales bacterium]